MTITERNQKLKHLITCMKCEVSGKVCDENCPVQYDAGNMGEIIENLEAISEALEQEPRWVSVNKKLPESDEEYSFFEHFVALLLLATNNETLSLIEKELENMEVKEDE